MTGVVIDPTSGLDYARSIVIAGNYIYVAGDQNPGDQEWAIRKLSKTDGALSWATTIDPTTGNDFIQAIAITSTPSHVFVAGYHQPGSTSWRIQKINASDGSNSGGWVTSIVGGVAYSIAITSTPSHVFVAGSSGRVQKINASDGSIAGGWVTSILAGGNIRSIVSSDNYLYLASEAISGDKYWHIQKINASDGSTAGGWITTIDPTIADDVAIAIAITSTPSHVFVAGSESTGAKWRVQKINASDGSTAGGWTTTSDPTSRSDAIGAMTIDSNYLYIAGGQNSGAWRIEKRRQSDGSSDWGEPLAAQDTAYTLASAGQEFRVRMLLEVGGYQLAASGQNFKLQYASTTDTCDSPIGGTWVDVSASTEISFKNNAIPSDNDIAATSTDYDPSHSGHTIRVQTYQEANNFTNANNAIAVGEDGLWDFALYDNSSREGVTYCMRALESDGTPLNTYNESTYIKITTYTTPGGALSCSFSTTTVSFGALTDGGITTAYSSTTLTITSDSAVFVKVYDKGGGGTAGLYYAGGPDLIDSADATPLTAGSEGYGLQATSTTWDMTIKAQYNYASTTDNVGGLELVGNMVTMASSSGAVTNAKVIIYHKATIATTILAGAYVDSLNYICVNSP